MPVYLLPDEPVFPPAEAAEADGLLAAGGDFSSERLLNAYASGIFPWFEEDDMIYWFSPDPRLVLFPENLKISNSLARVIKSGRFEIRYDTRFREVMEACAAVVRPDQQGTWINSSFIDGYEQLHHKGYAHSVECYLDGSLAGGLYGVSLGRAFFGESMFFKVADASKVALYHLVKKVSTWQFHFIDCQVETDHLVRSGATNIPRKEYLRRLSEALKYPTIQVFS